jgi:hypothetical protein
MTYEDDLDLERRLRLIAEDPEPAVPASLFRHLDRVAASAANVAVEDVRPTRAMSLTVVPYAERSRRSGRSEAKVLAAIAAALVLAMAGAFLLAALRTGGSGAASVPASVSALASDLWTGLEWHDITATSDGLFAGDPWEVGISFPDNVVTWPGGLAATTGSGVWTSADGRTWKQVSGPQYVKYLGALGGKLLAETDPVASCDETASGPCLTTGRMWTTTNGVDWTSELLPFAGSAMGLTTSATGAVMTVLPVTASDASAPKLLYVTADGVNWRQASMPNDMSTSLGLQVVQMHGGYFASGDDQGTAACWSSADGLTWLRVASPQSLTTGIYPGLRGLDSLGMHSIDGATWVVDQDQGLELNPSGAILQVLADGRHIVASEGWQTVFYFSLGDGHWLVLDQGGDVGSLPGGGQAWLLPDGLLYEGGGRLFYGQAVAGSPVQGTLRPAASISPPPTATPPAGSPQPTFPSSVIPAPTSQPSPAPSGP